MYPSELLSTIFLSSISFSAFLIVIISFLLTVYDKRRKDPVMAEPIKGVIRLIVLSFLLSIFSSLLSGGVLASCIFLCDIQSAKLLEYLIAPIVLIFLVSVILATYGTIKIIRKVMLIKLRG